MPIRPFSDRCKPGRVDINGIQWWACDPYPTWYRWNHGELIEPEEEPEWADEKLQESIFESS